MFFFYKKKRMDILFHKKFKPIIRVKTNRDKILAFLKDIVHSQTLNTTKQQELLYFYFYELHVEWNVFPKLDDFFHFIRQKKIGYHHTYFNDIKQENYEEENFIMNPPLIEEGVIECNRCKSKKTFSFNKQTRSSDEAVTVFVRCVNCGHQFRM